MPTDPRPWEPRTAPELLSAAGWLAILGGIALVAGNVIGSMVVPNHDWVADTVSDLAAGRYEIIQDVALYGYAAGLFALALGAAHAHPGESWRWTLGTLCLAMLAALVVVIGARNEYGDSDDEGVVIHIYLVYGLGLLFTLTFWAMARDLGRDSARDRWVSLACAVTWAVGSVIFFLLPTGIDGAWERGLGVITLVWVAMFARFLIRFGRD
ncbi:DUF998 domain-containing protein [Rhodobacteraceae bacterium CCMM004]|nr:DUF998 domain-containing protein [Rhodobacteraceae bacterium CCMM004]